MSAGSEDQGRHDRAPINDQFSHRTSTLRQRTCAWPLDRYGRSSYGWAVDDSAIPGWLEKEAAPTIGWGAPGRRRLGGAAGRARGDRRTSDQRTIGRGGGSSRTTSAGRVLINSSGFSLYVFSGDAAPTPVTSCLPANTAPTGTMCTAIWRPLLATGPLVAGPGVRAKGLAKLTRAGIGDQVTYFGQPLYTFVQDTAAGQINGQDITSFHGFWRLVGVDGKPAADRAAVGLELSADGPILKTTTAGGTARTLYNLTSDPPGGTACTAACTAFWPPVLTDRLPAAGPGVNRNALGLLHRPEGTLQVTYFGQPMYLYAFDLGAGQPGGQVNGNNNIDANVNGVWYSVAPDGRSNAGAVPVLTETAAAQTILAASAVSSGGTTATLYTFSLDNAADKRLQRQLRPGVAAAADDCASGARPGRDRLAAGNRPTPGWQFPDQLRRTPALPVLSGAQSDDGRRRQERLRGHVQGDHRRQYS